MALTKRTCAGTLLLEPQLAVTMLKAARAKARGRALKQRDILNSPRVGLVVSKKDFSSLWGGNRGIGPSGDRECGSSGLSRGPGSFPERFPGRFSELFPELCNWTPARPERLARGQLRSVNTRVPASLIPLFPP